MFEADLNEEIRNFRGTDTILRQEYIPARSSRSSKTQIKDSKPKVRIIMDYYGNEDSIHQ